MDCPTNETTIVNGKAIQVRTQKLQHKLKVPEAADFLRLNVKTVYAAISAGDIPGRKIVGRTVLLRDALLGFAWSSG